MVASVKAVACELPAQLELPFSRFSINEIRQHVIEQRIVESIGATTLWEWLHDDGIRPWTHRSWIFPRDPEFELKASRVVDLYERRWEGESLGENDYVISSDEKTSIQARQRMGSAPSIRRVGRGTGRGRLRAPGSWCIRRTQPL